MDFGICGRESSWNQFSTNTEGEYISAYLGSLTGVQTLMKVLVAQSCPTLCDSMESKECDFVTLQSSSMDYSPQGPSVHGILQARILEWVPFPSPGDLPDPGIEPRSPALQADTLPPEPRGKPEYQVVNLMIKFGEFMTAKQIHKTAPLPSKLLQYRVQTELTKQNTISGSVSVIMYISLHIFKCIMK